MEPGFPNVVSGVAGSGQMRENPRLRPGRIPTFRIRAFLYLSATAPVHRVWFSPWVALAAVC